MALIAITWIHLSITPPQRMSNTIYYYYIEFNILVSKYMVELKNLFVLFLGSLNPKCPDPFHIVIAVFLGSMLPQYMALSVSQSVSLVSFVKKNVGHF